MRRLALLSFACLPLLGACGAQPDDPPPVFETQEPSGLTDSSFAQVGMVVEHPENWRLRRREAPAVFELRSGESVIAAWAYPREEPLPEGDGELEAARERLVEAVEDRDPEYRLRRSAVTRVAGSPAIEIVGRQVIAERPVRIRSVHVFKGEIEYVIEAIAAPADRAVVERRVLEPLLELLEIDGEVHEDAE
ncbi:MAG TPA: hypothetical protein VD790_03135 [Thermoleophilaceae bacterium]|nr:hypothetical protein [Thermoleophilaceae bacterium]